MNTATLIKLSVDINSDIKKIKELYPTLSDFTIIKRLISKSDRWYKLMDEATTTTKEGGQS